LSLIFVNHLDRGLKSLKKLLVNETKLEVFFDPEYQFRSNVFLNIKINEADVLERFAGTDRLMQYNFNVRLYFRKAGAYREHTHLRPISNYNERILKLFANNPQPVAEDGLLWNTFFTNWGASSDYWNLLTSYIGHNFFINNVNYEPARSDSENFKDLYITEYDMSFNLIDSIPAS
jgi:hypothetical protein|tara:strand:- start:3298 stop:3825 length:528 start_codon:yes stop_codon:yes gene_type:complete